MQISEPVRNAQERLQLQVHAARLVRNAPCVALRCAGLAWSLLTWQRASAQVEAAQSLLRLTERLKRDTLLCDFGGRVAASDAAAAAAQARLAVAQEALRAAADAAAARLAGDTSGTGRGGTMPTLAHVGLEALSDDAAAELDPVTARLFAIASGVSEAAH